MADEKKEAAEESTSKSKLGILDNKAVVLGAIVIVQALVAIGLTHFVIVPKLGVGAADMSEQAVLEDGAEVPELGQLVGLEEIIVTLAGDAARPRYLRINITLEVKDALAAEVVGTRLPQLRDMVIMALSDRTAADMSTPDGKKTLRDEIFRRIDERMPPGTLMNVYFSDLVVQ